MAKAKKNQVNESIEKIQGAAKKLWLASLGAYSRSYNEVKSRVEKLNDDSQKLFTQLAKEGETVQGKGKGKYEAGTEKFEAKVSQLKTRLTYQSGLESKLDEVNGKLDKLATA